MVGRASSGRISLMSRYSLGEQSLMKLGIFRVRMGALVFRRHLLAILLSIATPLLMTWPLVTTAGRGVLGAIYYWDAYTNAMIMGSRVDAALGRAPLSLYDDYYFAPLPHSIVFNENHFGLSILFAPFYLLSESPIGAYNFTLLVSLGLAVFFMYLLVFRLTNNAYAGMVAGVAYAFSPYVFFELGRIQLMAVQWIPAIFLFLHRAIEEQRPRDSVAFWLCILLQIGTCLYYTMFLVPLLAVSGCILLFKQRPSFRFYSWFGATAVVSGLVAFLMVHPYFSVRDSFDLERTLAYASSNDGKFSFFANVHPTNRTLTSMHHLVGARGAHDEIAFPGFTALGLVLTALVASILRAGAHHGPLRVLSGVWSWLVLVAAATFATLLTYSMLPGLLVFGGGAWILIARGLPHPFHGTQGVYLALLLTALVMFLGIYPLTFHGLRVHGIYYYFHTYFPGFNGIRKVGRQALMTTFVLCVLGGFGAALLFARLRSQRDRLIGFVVLLAGLIYELRCFPHPIEGVWGADRAPAALRFVRTLPETDLIAFLPQDRGQRSFRGDIGMALHNYLALYHRHRFVNGQSSWQPPATDLALRALHALPEDGARRALLALGTRHLVLFGEELSPEQAGLRDQLVARPHEYQLVFEEGSHSVFTLVHDPTIELLTTPELPPNLRLIAQNELEANSPLRPHHVLRAFDGDPTTYWSGGRFQRQGQYFEVDLKTPRKVAALEIESPTRVMDVPVSFRLSAKNGSEDLGVIIRRPLLHFYREQVFTPQKFVFRLLLPQPIEADRLRITVEQAVPGSYFSIHELRLYESSHN
jgi:hypothetical protein